jgi:hypothetical protein
MPTGVPRMHRTFAGSKRELAAIGCTLTKKDGEYRVNLAGGLEASAYYTDNLTDAINTGKKMKEQGAIVRDTPSHKHPEGLNGRYSKETDEAYEQRKALCNCILAGMTAEQIGDEPHGPGCATGKDQATWERRVRKLEAEGATRSDAQSVVDAEDQRKPAPDPLDKLCESLAAIEKANRTDAAWPSFVADMRAILQLQKDLSDTKKRAHAALDLVVKLAEYLQEAHDGDVTDGHGGDEPGTCSYCKAIAEAEAMTGGK